MYFSHVYFSKTQWLRFIHLFLMSAILKCEASIRSLHMQMQRKNSITLNRKWWLACLFISLARSHQTHKQTHWHRTSRFFESNFLMQMEGNCCLNALSQLNRRVLHINWTSTHTYTQPHSTHIRCMHIIDDRCQGTCNLFPDLRILQCHPDA